MSEEILKALMQLFAIITKQDDGVSQAERAYVISFLKAQLNEKQVEFYLKQYDDYIKGNDQKSRLRKKKKESQKTDSKTQLKELLSEPILSKSDEELSPEELALKNRFQRKINRLEAKIQDEEEIKNSNKSSLDSANEGLTSMKDSVRTLSLCKKINKTLSQPQKVVVLVRLFELIKSDNHFTPQRIMIIDTVSEVFNFSEQEFKAIQTFVISQNKESCNLENILIANNDDKLNPPDCKHIKTEYLNGDILILKINSVDLYFMRFIGETELNFNGLIADSRRIYIFAPGSTIRLPKDKPIYYSDVVARFLSDSNINKLAINVSDLEYVFPNGNIGLRGIDISEDHGKLVGIMGSSGAGKTTLLNVLCGLEKPSKGSVKINGIDVHEHPEAIEGVIGYIPQDDILLEDLTVYQNLFYSAKLCFKNKADEEIDELVLNTLSNLGLLSTKDLKVGNPLSKTISGGQRKRLNIALELIREPSVLFVDEPTSGLSSRDSENVMDLLRELTLKGKSIFVVIHQPSSDIYKVFDKIVIIDTKGYPIYYGKPVEAVTYFKKIDHQVNADQGECYTCGNVDVELIFNIIESNVVDEYGRYTGERKVEPEEWSAHYKNLIEIKSVEDQNNTPEGSLDLPNKIKQWLIFSTRDLLSKLSNRQYLTINLLEAPVLALILSFIIRFVDNDGGAYVYGKNENIPAYIFICIIVALFMGLTVSAEEIVKDRKLLKRETFLNLSKGSYFFSKMGILFGVSAIQTFSFVLIGNLILGVSGILVESWFILFSVSCFANMLGLNISATFNSAITIYILIPILLIPQMVLSGAIFSFDKLHEWIGSDDEVPLIADLMVSRWAFEAMAVDQFKNNDFEQLLYNLEKKESKADYKQVYYIPYLQANLEECMPYIVVKNKEGISRIINHIDTLKQNLQTFDAQFNIDYDFYDNLDYSKVVISDLDSVRYHIASQIDKIKSNNEVKLLRNLYKGIDSCSRYIRYETLADRLRLQKNLKLLRNEIEKESKENIAFQFHRLSCIQLDSLDQENISQLSEYLKSISAKYTKDFALANKTINNYKLLFQEGEVNKKRYRNFKNNYHNDELASLVKKSLSKRRIKEKNAHLIQVIDPVYRDPSDDNFWFNYRAHFYAPRKAFLGSKFDTFWFNVAVIWFMSVALFFTLYFNILSRALQKVDVISNILMVYLEPLLINFERQSKYYLSYCKSLLLSKLKNSSK